MFAGYRYEQNVSYLRTWLSRQKTTRQIFPPPDPDHCQGCNSEHTVDNPYPNAAYVDREGGFQLNPPLCSWCWLRKLVDSEGVRTAGDRGFVGYINTWRFSANLDHLADLVAPDDITAAPGPVPSELGEEAGGGEGAMETDHGTEGEAAARATAALAAALPDERELEVANSMAQAEPQSRRGIDDDDDDIPMVSFLG